VISCTINYSKYETLIKIDIEHRPEQTIIPAFSIGLDIDYELFGGNVLGFSAIDTMDTEFLINEIFNQNHTRKRLSIDI
jgi:hypothetical protein